MKLELHQKVKLVKVAYNNVPKEHKTLDYGDGLYVVKSFDKLTYSETKEMMDAVFVELEKISNES